MFSPSRRQFLGASVAGLASSPLFGDPPPRVAREDAPFQPATLFLTWHTDPTTTMDVQWVGVRGETADPTVYYAPAGVNVLGPAFAWRAQKTTARPYPLSDFKVFRAELTGLAPGTDYTFKIGKQSPTYRFRTMPAKATDAITFVSGGDSGVNAAALANNQQAARQDPMFVVVGGDLAYDNAKSVETNLAYLKNYSRTMVGRDGRLIPLVAAIGNHEVDGGYARPREKATFFYPLFEGLYPETGYATLDFGDYLSLVLLDTGHTSAIGGEQADWLGKALKERAGRPHVFVVNHVPAYPSYRKIEGKDGKAGTGEGNRKHWVPLFEKHRVPVVLEHHDHTFKRTRTLLDGRADDNGVLYLGDGSWGRLRAPQKPEDLPYLAAASRDYHLSLHRLQGEERFHLALDENGRVMDVCRTGQRKTGVVPVGG
jgi:Purple acid Phosphatase, N-terminal domain/Calcineurin-like phosphoesterase